MISSDHTKYSNKGGQTPAVGCSCAVVGSRGSLGDEVESGCPYAGEFELLCFTVQLGLTCTGALIICLLFLLLARGMFSSRVSLDEHLRLVIARALVTKCQHALTSSARRGAIQLPEQSSFQSKPSFPGSVSCLRVAAA